MKNATIYIIMSLIIIGLVTATDETNIYRLTNVNEKAAQSTAAFSFITGTSGQPRVGQIYMYTTAGFVPSTMGGSCSVNQYIVAYQCQTSTGSTCQRMFTDDWLKESSTNLLPYSNWQNEAWFKDAINKYGYKYAAYECLAAKSNPINEKPLYTSSTGQFLTVTLPTSGYTDGKSTIKGTYKVTSEGWFILEAGIDQGSRGTTFNIAVSSSASSCDGSGYYAGTRIYGKPGDVYEFAFTIKNPSNEGTYTITAHAWTDCAKNGGKYITGTTGRISLKKPLVTLSSCGSTDTDGDGIKDGCDACPKDYGIADKQGCHPCYGHIDVTSTEAKNCYYTNQEKYGIPIYILDMIDPYITAIQECRDNVLATVKIRQSGLRSTIGTPTTCPTGTTCTTESTTSASCKTTTMKSICFPDGNKLCKSGYSNTDGTLMCDLDKIIDCPQGCKEGACISPLQKLTCNTKQDCINWASGKADITNTKFTSLIECTSKICWFPDDKLTMLCAVYTTGGAIEPCKAISPTVVKIEKTCSGNDIIATQTLSDGNIRNLGKVSTCEPSKSQCIDGTCQTLICEDCTDPIVVTDPECSATSDCPNGHWCDGTKKCAPISLSTCTSNADCKDPTRPICNLQIGACIAEQASECSETKTCTSSNDKCLEGFCVPKDITVINDTINPIPCTADQEETCGDGSTIRSALCVNGELEPIGINCENAGGNDNTITEQVKNILSGITIPGIPATITIPGTKSTFNPTLAIGIIIIIAIVFFVLKKTGPKKKKSKKKG
jgi:hypothetical protein